MTSDVSALIPLAFGAGRALADPHTGALQRFEHPEHPDQAFLSSEFNDKKFGREMCWGSGFVTIDGRSFRWLTPDALEVKHDGDDSPRALTATFTFGHQLELVRTVSAADERMTEVFQWKNISKNAVVLDTIGIYTPFRDVYESEGRSFTHSVNTHLFPGGRSAWVLAEAMSFQGPRLGLKVTEGYLNAYSVEGRHIGYSSHHRGFFVLHPTDGRNPDAFGGQSPIELAPGETFTLSWELAWYPDRESFLAEIDSPWPARPLMGRVTDPLPLEVKAGYTPSDIRVLATEKAADGTQIPAARVESGALVAPVHGIQNLELDGHRTAALMYRDVRELVEARIAYLLEFQRASHRDAPDSGAFLVTDTSNKLSVPYAAWGDHSDGAERIGMAALLQQARRRGWGDAAAIDAALAAWMDFAHANLYNPETWLPKRGSQDQVIEVRLYNAPWLIHVFADQYLLDGQERHLEAAWNMLEASFAAGAREHLSIDQIEGMEALLAIFEAAGDARADTVREMIVSHAEYFRGVGEKLVAHEVAYEQSMVAPLVRALSAGWAHSAQGQENDDAWLPHIARALGWLRGFGGPQPHARLYQVGIRHWDGYWFGRERMWGDTFPHYWSVLSANAYLALPPALRSDALDADARSVYVSNLASFYDDGSATCAFIFPSAVNGSPAYVADSLANDQDWALVWMLRNTP
ncbi:hypothetical protein [Haematomicrobium sanguinis]|uniref:hypothetical protein n=1 Tax=Haematomicrobium sanguinis TaxID=479106 RepID=UPI000557AFE2|nr:hypothetical protein [Haematomicrobium sanguinis]